MREEGKKERRRKERVTGEERKDKYCKKEKRKWNKEVRKRRRLQKDEGWWKNVMKRGKKLRIESESVFEMYFATFFHEKKEWIYDYLLGKYFPKSLKSMINRDNIFESWFVQQFFYRKENPHLTFSTRKPGDISIEECSNCAREIAEKRHLFTCRVSEKVMEIWWKRWKRKRFYLLVN